MAEEKKVKIKFTVNDVKFKISVKSKEDGQILLHSNNVGIKIGSNDGSSSNSRYSTRWYPGYGPPGLPQGWYNGPPGPPPPGFGPPGFYNGNYDNGNQRFGGELVKLEQIFSRDKIAVCNSV